LKAKLNKDWLKDMENYNLKDQNINIMAILKKGFIVTRKGDYNVKLISMKEDSRMGLNRVEAS
jgi:hypothetical protein